MQPIELFHAHSRPDGRRLRLVGKEQRDSVVLEGQVLEAQYEHRGNYLLFTTGDCPFEESLSVYYLCPRLRVLDEIELGAPYSTGEFSRHRIAGEDTGEFSFFEDDLWRLTVRTRPRLRLELPAIIWRRPKGLRFRSRDCLGYRYIRLRSLQ